MKPGYIYKTSASKRASEQRRRDRNKHSPEWKAKKAAATASYRNRNREVTRENNRNYWRKKIGVSTEHVNSLLDAQGFCCAICGHPDGTGSSANRRLHVDHCHQSNKIRGMLCHHCNTGLGHFKDSLGLLRNAMQYLLDRG